MCLGLFSAVDSFTFGALLFSASVESSDNKLQCVCVCVFILMRKHVSQCIMWLINVFLMDNGALWHRQIPSDLKDVCFFSVLLSS